MDDTTYFRYRILGDEPAFVGDVADALKSIQSIYRSSLYKNRELLDTFEERLYVGRVKEGSQIYDLVAMASIGALPLVSDMNATATLFKNLKGMTEYFLRKRKAPKKIKPKDCSNIANFVMPGVNEGISISVGQGDVNIDNLTLNITPQETKKIIHNAMAEKALLEAPEVEFKRNQILKFIQANAIRTATQGMNSPDKGIIQDISTDSHSVVSDEELMSQKTLLLKDNNFYTSSFMVDVEIARSNGKIKAYLIKKIALI